MKKRKSVRETKNMVQTALWLPRDLHERLKKEGGERGMGDEIRRRLQLSLDIEGRPDDQVTRLLIDLIERIAVTLSLDEHWWANRFARNVFEAAIHEVLSEILSMIGTEPKTGEVTKLQARYGSDEETIGRVLARAAFVGNANEQLKQLCAVNQET